ncbi:hypothetical protein NAPIS_ORF01299 [Vairimorpha apis BRL 01]|uniref:Uncharacterized protein n=1 Tax=Vairimorpha apis BRL 01 TaxID=1037528 RepID=T0L0M7_9MICR|nr:hypothetical protein NAPIS_ORF01299 [Vairimorpha apis BRL 01]
MFIFFITFIFKYVEASNILKAQFKSLKFYKKVLCCSTICKFEEYNFNDINQNILNTKLDDNKNNILAHELSTYKSFKEKELYVQIEQNISEDFKQQLEDLNQIACDFYMVSCYFEKMIKFSD